MQIPKLKIICKLIGWKNKTSMTADSASLTTACVHAVYIQQIYRFIAFIFMELVTYSREARKKCI